MDKETPPAPRVSQNIPPIPNEQEGLTVVISRDTMGSGKEELGKILIKGFIYSLTELPIAPAYIIFLNSGVYLTSNQSNTINDLKKLEEKGTKILVCGTCVNYYGLENCLAVGSITNMFIKELELMPGYGHSLSQCSPIFLRFFRNPFDVKNQTDTLPYQMEMCRFFQWLLFRWQDFPMLIYEDLPDVEGALPAAQNQSGLCKCVV